MRLTAKIAPFRDAIAAARRAGVTWPELGALLNADPDRLRWACTKGKRYEAAEQRPLPAAAQPAASTQQTPGARTTTPQASPPLPGQKPAPAGSLSALDEIRAQFDR